MGLWYTHATSVRVRMDLLPITIDDELSGSVALRFAERLSRLPLEDVDGLVLHFNEESHLDVSGIAVIVRVYSKLRERKKVLYLYGVSVAVARALARLGLADVLNVPQSGKRPPKDTDPSLSVLATRDYPVVPS